MREGKKKVIFVAYTATHLMSAIYYSQKINWDGYEKVLIFQQVLSRKLNCRLMDNFFDTIIVFDRSEEKSRVKRLIKNQIMLGRLYSFSNIHKMIANDSVILFVFSDQNSLSFNILKQVYKKENGVVLLVDEGTGTYAVRKAEHSVLSIKNAILGYNTTPYIGSSNLFDAWIVNEPSLLPQKKVCGKTVIKKNNFFIDDEFVNYFMDKLGILNYKITGKSILVVSSPLSDVNISEEEEVSFWERIVVELKEYKFIFKLHPRENLNKYQRLTQYTNVEILSLGEYFWIPVEIFAKHYSPRAVLTICSSASRELQKCGVSSKYYYCYKLFDNLVFDYNVFNDLINVKNNYFPESFSNLIDSIKYDAYISQNISIQNGDEDIKYIDVIKKQLSSNCY